MSGLVFSDVAWGAWEPISSYTGALNDRIFNFLRDEGYTGALADMMYAYLGDKGYTGTIEKRMVDSEVTFADATLYHNFAKDKVISGRAGPALTFTRASNGTYFDQSGILQTATTNVPRFDHDPSSLQSLGLLIEEARENLCLQSEDFATTWGSTRATVSANAVVAPDGNTTADSLNEDGTAASNHRVEQGSITFTDNTVYCFSVFLKKANRGWALLQVRNKDGSQAGKYFDLNTGSVGADDGVPTASGIIDVGNGWYRCWIVDDISNGVTGPVHRIYAAEGNADITFDGLSQASIYMWGAQIE